MLICVACRRKVDVDRSFCRSCGSSVFVDSDDRNAVPHFDSSPSSLSGADTHQPVPKPRKLKKPPRETRATGPSTVRAGAGCLSAIVRLAIVLAIIWYGGGWFINLPEVAALKDAIQRGEVSDDTIRATVEGLRRRVERFFGDEPADQSLVPGRDPEPVAVPREAPAFEGSARPGLTPPPGVYLPGNGVTMPRLLRQVNPQHTEAAIRGRIEGPVVLSGIVEPNGRITSVEIVESLDPRGLDAAAVLALREWHFVPGERGGEPVRVLITVTMNFTLPRRTNDAR